MTEPQYSRLNASVQSVFSSTICTQEFINASVRRTIWARGGGFVMSVMPSIASLLFSVQIVLRDQPLLHRPFAGKLGEPGILVRVQLAADRLLDKTAILASRPLAHAKGFCMGGQLFGRGIAIAGHPRFVERSQP